MIVLGICSLIAAIPLVICINHDPKVGDSANWLQAIVAILTLLSVIYAAIKASEAAKNTENIAENSNIINERSYITNVLKYLCENANKSLIKTRNVYEQGKNGEKDISVFITSILRCHHTIDGCKYKDSYYYKKIIESYLDTDSIIEIQNENQLQLIFSTIKNKSLLSDIKKQYQDARKFLDKPQEML